MRAAKVCEKFKYWFFLFSEDHFGDACHSLNYAKMPSPDSNENPLCVMQWSVKIAVDSRKMLLLKLLLIFNCHLVRF